MSFLLCKLHQNIPFYVLFLFMCLKKCFMVVFTTFSSLTAIGTLHCVSMSHMTINLYIFNLMVIHSDKNKKQIKD